jgi:hypothetical protein
MKNLYLSLLFLTSKPWPQPNLDLLTDEKGNTIDAIAEAAYQNRGY